MKKITVTATVVAALLGIGYVVSLLAVRPMSTDLSVVGQGKPALVLVYENFSPASTEGLERLKQVRDDYEASLSFVVADLGVPAGQNFARRHGLGAGHVLLLGADGEPRGMVPVPADERALRAGLDNALSTLR